jgi:hypothetical protein
LHPRRRTRSTLLSRRWRSMAFRSSRSSPLLTSMALCRTRLRRPCLLRSTALLCPALLRRMRPCLSASRFIRTRLGSLTCSCPVFRSPIHLRLRSLTRTSLSRSVFSRMSRSRTILRRPARRTPASLSTPVCLRPSRIRASRSLPAALRPSRMRSSMRPRFRTSSLSRTSRSRPRRRPRLTRSLPCPRSLRCMTSFTSVINRTRPTSRYNASALKFPRLRRSRDRRPPMILSRQHRAVATRGPPLLRLPRRQMHTRIASRRLLSRRRPSPESAPSAVVAYPAHRAIVHRPARIHMVKPAAADPVHRTVVIESSVIPVATRIPHAGITKPIVDAAIEAHRRPPIAGIPEIRTAAPAPVSRSPQHTHLRRLNPRSGNPVITLIAVSPITGSPYIPLLRTDRLLIRHQRRRSDRNRHPNLRHRRDWHRSH